MLYSKLQGNIPKMPIPEEKDFFDFQAQYLRHLMPNQVPDFHKELISLLQQNAHPTKPLVIAAPRGFAKSTLVSLMYVIWLVAHRKKQFILLVSATESLAKSLLSALYDELVANTKLQQQYHLLDIRMKGAQIQLEESLIFARGRRHMLRGFHHKGKRPDFVLLDDLEKDGEALNPYLIEHMLDTILFGLYPAMDVHGQMVLLGTVLRQGSLLDRIFIDSDQRFSYWEKRRYRALQTSTSGKLESLWPERFSVQALQSLRLFIGEAAFQSEYQNNPLCSSDTLFNMQKMHYYEDMTNICIEKTVLFLDPSLTNKESSDYKAIIVLGQSASNTHYVLDAWIRKDTVSSMVQKLVDLAKKHMETLTVVGVEGNGFQRLLEKDITAEASKQNVSFPLRFVIQKTPKRIRIEKLVPLIEQGVICFPLRYGDSDHSQLLDQMLYYGSNRAHDDGVDALEAAYSLLQSGVSTPVRTHLLPQRHMIRGQ